MGKIIKKIIGYVILTFFISGAVIFIAILANGIDLKDDSTMKVITAIGLISSISGIIDWFKNDKKELETIQKQNEELKSELDEIKKIVQEEPKEYKIDVKVIT